jgi:midasin
LLERISACVAMNEPALLVGDTGNGKTSVVQALALACGTTLHVQNLNVQTDSGDLFGGYRPVQVSTVAVPVSHGDVA